MKTNKKISWEKYENSILEQIDSELLKQIDLLHKEEEKDEYDEYDDDVQPSIKTMRIVSEDVIRSANISSSFNCWIGHTNFNITQDVFDKLEKMEGVEALKICTRYRFFIGVGRMFDFSDVRLNIEESLTR